MNLCKDVQNCNLKFYHVEAQDNIGCGNGLLDSSELSYLQVICSDSVTAAQKSPQVAKLSSLMS